MRRLTLATPASASYFSASANREYCGDSLRITLKGFHTRTQVVFLTMKLYLVIAVSNRGAGGVNGLSFVVEFR